MADSVRLDPVDLGILRELQNDARISNKELAAVVGIAPSTCLDRVARLRSAGVITGTVGTDRTISEGYEAARACVLTQLAVLKRTLGSLAKVKEIVSVNGYVNAIAGFPDPPKVINGASDLLLELFGESGKHARAAIGVSALPRNALVEVQMIVAI